MPADGAGGATPHALGDASAAVVKCRSASGCGKRHIDAPTHESQPFGLSHVPHVPSAAPTPRAAPTPPSPSDARAPHSASLASASYADARGGYDSNRTRFTSSSIFSDFSYPHGPQ